MAQGVESQQRTRSNAGVAVYLIRQGELGTEVLLLQRAGPRFFGEWFPIEGWIEDGESAECAAWREIGEETAIEPIAFYRALTEPVGSAVDVPIHVFVGFVDAATEVVLNREHSRCEWLAPAAALRRLPLAEQKRVMNQIVADFIDRPPPEALRITATPQGQSRADETPLRMALISQRRGGNPGLPQV
jgi:8-oxo-dGTP pyrophosphatase MutT (NUDIX family)